MSHIPRNEILNMLYVNLAWKVGLWLEGYLNGLSGAFQWLHLAKVVCKRLCDNGVFVMEDSATFKQVVGVVEFIGKFEEFRSLLL